MSRRAAIIVIALALALAGAAAYAALRRTAPPASRPASRVPAAPAASAESVEDLVRRTIGALSPVPPVLGGTYYVTSVTAGDGTGTVAYEDGHVAHVADFAYDTGPDGAVRVTAFTVRTE